MEELRGRKVEMLIIFADGGLLKRMKIKVDLLMDVLLLLLSL